MVWSRLISRLLLTPACLVSPAWCLSAYSRDDPNYYRTVYDAVNDRTVVLSDRYDVG